jgi:predicted MFS family arabinose efflux permease
VSLDSLHSCKLSQNDPSSLHDPALSRKPQDKREPASGRLMAAVALLPLAAGYFLSYLFRNVNGVIAGDIMRDLGTGAGALGLLTSVYFLTFAAAQLPVGVLLDRYGPRRVQSALLMCAAVGAGLCALDGGFAVLLLGRALIGVGTAGGLVAGLKASAVWFPRERLAAVNGAFIMCGGLGALAATWPVEFMLHLTDWRGLSVVLAVFAFAVAVAVHRIVPDRQPGVVLRCEEVHLRGVVRDPMFRRFAPLSASCFGTVLAVQGLWAGPWLTDVDGLSRSDVSNDLACMAIVLVVAAPCWGVLTQWLRRRVRLPHAAAGAALVLMAAEVLILARTGLPSALPWCLFAVFGGMSVLSYSVLAEHFPAAAIGRANGAFNVLHIGFSFVVQLGIGQVIALWEPVAGQYPTQAYQAGLLLPLSMQTVALLWFAWPRRALHPA